MASCIPRRDLRSGKLLVAPNELRPVGKKTCLDPSLLHKTERPSQISHVELKSPAKSTIGQSWLSLESKDVVVSEVGENIRLNLGLAQDSRGDNEDDVLSFMLGGKVDTAGLVSRLKSIVKGDKGTTNLIDLLS